ncbi:TIGR00270 family protein [Methanobacterium sp. CWC-01]|jgi:putative transcription factor|uniref:multiprotein bridging factor aMBF1 n=1 Tax=Methanobacterium aridiramus TaxID=2584467 RepID=UPI0025768134|nr:multiprotein bridging factor aMBF1 [Methanobacterium sp. CWC-01]WJI09078.1 TIGR00270 family protein [Methanobacterium sp. CWC-01]
MRCEICGKKIIGQPIKTKIESSVMNTCKECSKFGKVQREPPRPQGQFRRTSSGPGRKFRSTKPSYEVIEDYNKVVRESREKKGWSREELAEKIYEKVSVINRIESGRMIPDMKLSRKLEKILGITILEKTDETIAEEVSSRNVRGATIGDIARIKRN